MVKILIVEDDNSLAELIKIYLASEEWDTAVAGTGYDALTMIEESEFNFIRFATTRYQWPRCMPED